MPLPAVQLPEADPGQVRGDGLHPGLLPLRPAEQQQAVRQVAPGGVWRV